MRLRLATMMTASGSNIDISGLLADLADARGNFEFQKSAKMFPWVNAHLSVCLVKVLLHLPTAHFQYCHFQ